jgi:pimeloyl-ACP methyl ester carboxylesterase
MTQTKAASFTPSRILGILIRTFFVLGLLSIIVPIGMCANLTGDMRTAIPDAKAVLTYKVEAIDALATDQLHIRGWYIPGRLGRTAVILCHGVGASRLQMLPQAEFLASMGHPVILFDFRNHGESDPARTSYGAWERHDIAAMVAEMAHRNPNTPIVLWGLSMGASTALLAAPELGPIKGVIAESPFDSLENTFYHHNRLYVHLPSWPAVPLTLAFMGWAAGFDPADVAPMKAVERSAVPILFVTSPEDKRMPPDVVRRTAAHHAGRAEMFVGKGGHAFIFAESGEAYRRRVHRFLMEIQESTRKSHRGD